MTHQDLHNQIGELLYVEDTGMLDIIMASIVANSMKIGDPVWLTLIGPSSGGKSQVIRPFSQANALIHRIDDLTANSMLSGSQGMEKSFLGNIGEHGILSMDDLTVLFSKNTEARGEILSQFRMLYDGRFAKVTGGHNGEMVWEGYLGMISGSTPSIYRFFGEVADMGERFVNYRMKGLDSEKMLAFIAQHPHSSRELDVYLTDIYKTYIADILANTPDELLTISPEIEAQISNAAHLCCLLRTPVHVDDRLGLVDEFPEPEKPTRVMKQLLVLAKGLQIVQQKPLDDESIIPLLWVAYSLSNDKRRAYLREMVQLERAGEFITARNLSAATGLNEEIIKKGVDHLQALNIVSLTDEASGTKQWRLTNSKLVDFVKHVDPLLAL